MSDSNAYPDASYRFVYEGQAKERLDLVVARLMNELTRSQVRRLIISGFVTLNGRNAKPGAVLHAGDLVEVIVPPSPSSELQPEYIPLHVLHEDPHILVINKPAALVVHPGPGHASGTLVQALLALYPALESVGGFLRAGLVHRLDKDTSGVMIVAKTEKAHRHLTLQFKERRVEKTYLALVHGRIQDNSGTISLPLGRHATDRKRISTHTKKPRVAITRWQILQRLPNCTFLRVKPETGRTHQIRAHLAAIHHPVVGDPLYGGKARTRKIPAEGVRRRLLAIPRQFLHAESLSVTHPHGRDKCTFRAPVPSDLIEILRFLGIDSVEEFDNRGAFEL